jgi:hypothetical protein
LLTGLRIHWRKALRCSKECSRGVCSRRSRLYQPLQTKEKTHFP